MKRVALFAAGVALAMGCHASAVPDGEQKLARASAAPRLRVPDVELFFKGDQPFARRGAEEWPIGDVTKAEMFFAPNGKEFAYVKQKATAEAGKSVAPPHVIVRNLAGDPVNEFPLYRAGKPDELIWIDNHRLGYLSPASADGSKKVAPVYVVHDANTGEVLAARSGLDFIWGPGHKHVAFVSGAPLKQQVVVDGQTVWPRFGTTKVHTSPVWSPDGHGLAFTEDGKDGPRLVVLVEFDDAQGDLTWPIPRDALGTGLRVFWAGDSKVVIGESALKPRFAADWKRIQ